MENFESRHNGLAGHMKLLQKLVGSMNFALIENVSFGRNAGARSEGEREK